MECPYVNCRRTFTKQSGLTQHIRYHHPERAIFEDDQAIENNDNIFNGFFSSPDGTSISENENVEEMMLSLPNIIEFSEYAYSEPSVSGDAHSELSDASEKDSVDSDDFKGASFLECAEESSEKHGLQWPNEAYRDFARICVNFDFSDSATDSLIRFFNSYTHLEKPLLPTSAREMRRFMNSIEAPLLDFQEKSLLEFEGLSYTLYYRPIIKTIKALLNKPDIVKEFISSYQEKTINEVSIEI
jgi:hypothetical protein